MRHRSVSDLMTPTAVSVQRGTTFKEIARLLDEFGITAVPVVDEYGCPVGIVSEADLIRRHGTGNTAVDLMSHPAITAAPGWSAVRAARVMEKHKAKRLPVIDSEGRLIGVLSRSDLLQLFLRRDHAIQEEILEDVLTHTLRLSPSSLTVEVTDGVVTLSGILNRRSLVPVVLRLCRSVDGVVDVINRLDHEQDNLSDDVRMGTRKQPRKA
ncbi:CBS domain-containing protein [Streptomyces sp. NBC_00439]|uniref:CBS domain-containing protein n=1 Tax=Streptomyces sp. NBC_00439 TaxID=2903650 RepID=UPI0022596D32|nr:CBS domain-containing protein [Streptomyces sp. NBC_00439]MCX5098264.1 CBS domain-containing protein [Streptomyces sp. NBC_00439]